MEMFTFTVDQTALYNMSCCKFTVISGCCKPIFLTESHCTPFVLHSSREQGEHLAAEQINVCKTVVGYWNK